MTDVYLCVYDISKGIAKKFSEKFLRNGKKLIFAIMLNLKRIEDWG